MLESQHQTAARIDVDHHRPDPAKQRLAAGAIAADGLVSFVIIERQPATPAHGWCDKIDPAPAGWAHSTGIADQFATANTARRQDDIDGASDGAPDRSGDDV
jgi:hypothetical protein